MISTVFNIVRDVLAIIGLLWIALAVFFAFADAAKARSKP